MHPMLNIAIRGARNAGDLIQRSATNIGQLTLNNVNKLDVEIEIGHIAENEMIQVIKTAYPEHSIVSAISEEIKGNHYTWLIGSLDSSKNFLQGYPHYALSIALKNKGKIELGVIYDPLKDELFTAEKGAGAMLNSRRIRMSKQTELSHALLGSCFPSKTQHLETYLDMLRVLLLETKDGGIRQSGSIALNLAYLAAGRLDGVWGIALNQLNLAAGLLLVQEAGGVVTDLSFNDDYLNTGHLITGNPKMHQAIYKTIQPQVSELSNRS